MTLKSLFQKRTTAYVKELVKYARFIFNDHFTLIIFMLIGIGGYAYSNYLDTLTTGLIGPRIFVSFIFFLAVTSGSVTTLVERADQIFLLPKEKEFHSILKRMVLTSYLEKLLVIGATTFVTFPIFVATLNAQVSDGLWLFFALAAVKWLNHVFKLSPFFHQRGENQRQKEIFVWLGSLAAIISLVFVTIEITAILVIAFALFLAFLFFTEKIYFKHLIKWETLITTEEGRLHRLYRVIEMFTDVPNMATKVKRLTWLDSVLNTLSQSYPEAPYYYTLRTVARNTEYSMLVLRVTLVGSILLMTTDSLMLSILLMILFLYMIGFQLISLTNEIDHLPQFQIYPIADGIKTKSILLIIFQILIFASILLTLSAIVNLGWMAGILLVFGVVFTYAFSYFYAPKRLKKNEKA